MANLQLKERLQPSLLDRLTDNEPLKTTESNKQRVYTLSAYRASVIRDLQWLFNTCNFIDCDELCEDIVCQSVVNYGLPDLAGLSISNLKANKLENMIKQVIINYEPRILAKSIKVRLLNTERKVGNSLLGFDIQADLYAIPVPLEFFFKTEIDLEDGQVSMTDLSS
jgi:type VI secretion system protein ImpF